MSTIEVRGARTHNLRSIDVSIPTGKLVVITGPSGAGKSSLAFDTLQAEAQRRYIESLSIDARQHLARLPKPDVDAIDGLSPAIALRQHPRTRTPRSTLGTLTEIADHLRLLFARVGEPHCPICGKRLRAETAEQIVDGLLDAAVGAKITLLAPVARKVPPGEERALLERLRREGWVRAKVDSRLIDLGEVTSIPGKRAHDIDVVIDRLVVKSDRDALRVRATDSVEHALRVGGGRMLVERDGEESTWHSERFACEVDDFTFPPIEPSLFSFNAPDGACPTCDGLGEQRAASARLIVPDERKSLRQGAVVAWGPPTSVAHAVALERAVTALGVDPDAPFEDLDEAVRDALLNGGAVATKKKKKGGPYEGVVAWVERQLEGEEDEDRVEEGGLLSEALDALREARPCTACNGARLRREALAVTLGGASIADVMALPLPRAVERLARLELELPPRAAPIAKPLLAAVAARLGFLVDVGLHYLTLDRPVGTLSTGESSRARLATQLAGGLRGVLYVLDEPSIGLHARDGERLIEALQRLRDLGNSLVVVEHDLAMIAAADHVIDVGPRAGRGGGTIVAQGTPDEIAHDPSSVTGPWLAGAASLARPKRLAPDLSRMIRVRDARVHNLRGVDVDVPLGLFVVFTGPSGSGKTSLVEHTIVPALRLGRIASDVERVVAIDQTPLGRTPRSNPASYVGVLAKLRELFSGLPEARARGYGPGRFSANVKGGRCEACKGDGVVRIEMRFLADVYVTCDVCKGRRFNRETLEIKYRGRSIADVLSTSVDDAHVLFEGVPPVREPLAALRSVGLGYLELGQPSNTLSGGEAQRVKIARELSRRGSAPPARTVYVLDEPTTGLHAVDVRVLLDALIALRDVGSSLLVIEHDLELAACADYVVDMGPEAGDAGGRVVAQGPPEVVAASTTSVTAPYLRRALARDKGQ